MQPLDLTSVPGPQLTFEVAYTYWTVPYQFSDTLEVLVSSDCGTSWTSLYKKWGNTLKTAPGQASDFIPTAAQWRLETIDLSAYATNSNVQVMFRNISDFENNLYVDDINLSSYVGINELENLSQFSVSPNPSNGIFNFYFKQTKAAKSELKIYNALGALVYEKAINEKNSTLEIDLTKLSKGIYHAEWSNDAGKTSKKIVIE